MKKILTRILVVMLLITIVAPLLPVSAASTSLTQQEMMQIRGGSLAQCPGAANFIQMMCYFAGGTTTTCTIAYGLALITCVVANIL